MATPIINDLLFRNVCFLWLVIYHRQALVAGRRFSRLARLEQARPLPRIEETTLSQGQPR